jgi:hypothetical protein
MRLRPPYAHLCICTKGAQPPLTNINRAGVIRLRCRREP